jgi:hypothetical protein
MTLHFFLSLYFLPPGYNIEIITDTEPRIIRASGPEGVFVERVAASGHHDIMASARKRKMPHDADLSENITLTDPIDIKSVKRLK